MNIARKFAAEIKLMDSTDGIDSSEAKDKLKNGLAHADKGRMDSACELLPINR